MMTMIFAMCSSGQQTMHCCHHKDNFQVDQPDPVVTMTLIFRLCSSSLEENQVVAVPEILNSTATSSLTIQWFFLFFLSENLRTLYKLFTKMRNTWYECLLDTTWYMTSKSSVEIRQWSRCKRWKVAHWPLQPFFFTWWANHTDNETLLTHF